MSRKLALRQARARHTRPNPAPPRPGLLSPWGRDVLEVVGVIAVIAAVAGLWFQYTEIRSNEAARAADAVVRQETLASMAWETLDRTRDRRPCADGAALGDADCPYPRAGDRGQYEAVQTLAGMQRLSGADLSRQWLEELQLPGADLVGADLSGATLWGANLSGATLRDADLSGATLTGATLSFATLSDADLSFADLSGATLNGADLSGAVIFIDDPATGDVKQLVVTADLSPADRAALLTFGPLSRTQLASACLGPTPLADVYPDLADGPERPDCSHHAPD